MTQFKIKTIYKIKPIQDKKNFIFKKFKIKTILDA